ncbi:hypothetical protein N7509_004138 [Penicillium cosmopolitanum]|uniref:U6 snRNA phosphodiesterase n=1 Tax=Penicillium cosmopolitanum TaxID=1131564 RepID=A0A9W9W6F1_9EURO|nr:uncharacterized protein N7509_004138 [Penicillium cosmopolitanum]KAJ5404267.1 hypothetical protein N7509_004138 [Penicillium cosmopolitanum]
MSLVQYSSSDSESESTSPPRKKVARPAPTNSTSLPPLPASFHSLYASTRVSTKDDPSLHAGRKRAIPHVEGNWPTHLYLEWVPGKEEVHLLADLIQAADANTSKTTASSSAQSDNDAKVSDDDSASTVHSLLHSDLGAQLPLHISLSRPVILRTEQRASFTEAFSEGVRSSGISPFNVYPETLKWVSNYEKTRWFLVLRVSKPKADNLNRLLGLCNSTLHRFGQPPLYARADPMSERSPDSGPAPGSAQTDDGDFSGCFHISIAWCLNAPDSTELERVNDVKLDKAQAIDVPFPCVKAKIGNYVESFELPVRA